MLSQMTVQSYVHSMHWEVTSRFLGVLDKPLESEVSCPENSIFSSEVFLPSLVHPQKCLFPYSHHTLNLQYLGDTALLDQ